MANTTDPSTHEDLVRVYEEINKQLEDQGITKSELARRVGCTRQYINDTLNCKNFLGMQKLRSIAEALDCTLDIKLVRKNTLQNTQKGI